MEVTLWLSIILQVLGHLIHLHSLRIRLRWFSALAWDGKSYWMNQARSQYKRPIKMDRRTYSGESDVPSAYSGGYSEAIKKQLESVNLPEKVKCKTCKKFRMQGAYSKRQLEILRNAVVVQGSRAATAGHATCRTCTGGQTTELRCCICDQVKGLEEFAVNQRREHENARCLVCVQGHADAEPVLDEHKLITDNELSTTAASRIGGTSLIGSSRELTLSEAPGNTSYGSSLDDDDNVSVGGGVWVEHERQDANSSKGKVFNFSGYGKTNLAASDTRSVQNGWDLCGVASSRVDAASMRTDKKDSKFPKIPAWRVEKPEGANTTPRAPEVTGHIVHSDDEEDEADVADFL